MSVLYCSNSTEPPRPSGRGISLLNSTGTSGTRRPLLERLYKLYLWLLDETQTSCLCRLDGENPSNEVLLHHVNVSTPIYLLSLPSTHSNPCSSSELENFLVSSVLFFQWSRTTLSTLTSGRQTLVLALPLCPLPGSFLKFGLWEHAKSRTRSWRAVSEALTLDSCQLCAGPLLECQSTVLYSNCFSTEWSVMRLDPKGVNVSW